MSNRSDNISSVRHSPKVEEIITKRPKWILRWGVTVFALILAGLIVLSGFIRYPRLAKAKIRIDRTSLPLTVHSDSLYEGTLTLEKPTSSLSSADSILFRVVQTNPFTNRPFIKGELVKQSSTSGDKVKEDMVVRFDHSENFNSRSIFDIPVEILIDNQTVFQRVFGNVLNPIPKN